MMVESVAVLIVLLLLLFVFLRSKHVGYAVAVLPVGIIPVVYLLAVGMLYFAGGSLFGARGAIVLLFCNVMAMALCCTALAIISRTIIKSKRNRRLYLAVMLVFCVLLGWVYIYNALQYVL